MLQALLCFIVLYINLSLLKWIKPYNKDYLNWVDEYASLAAVLTLLSGVLFLDGDLEGNENGIIMILIVIVSMNVVFLLYWCFCMARAVFSRAKEMLSAKLRREII